jgi:hypothetical protein
MISKISIGLFSLLSFSLMFAGFYVGDGLSGFGLILFMTSLLFAAEFLLTPTARFMVVVNNLSLWRLQCGSLQVPPSEQPHPNNRGHAEPQHQCAYDQSITLNTRKRLLENGACVTHERRKVHLHKKGHSD